MSRILIVGLGGFLGSVLRYLLSGFVQDLANNFEFPYGTLVINVAGCFVLGFLSQLTDAYGMFSSDARLFLFIGILGGFTTFSTFSAETFNLLRDGQSLVSIINVGCHIFFGLAGIWAGRVLVHQIWR